MAFIGNQPYQAAFVTDTFSGNGSTTAFAMSVAPANTASVLVAITGVLQDPSTYSVVGTTLTFSAAPPIGTGNISCRYLGIPASGVTTTAYRTVTDFTATAGQTTFTPPSYTVGFINVYQNGSHLGLADYTATNGTTVVLAAAAAAGDLITVESFLVSSVLNAIPATAGSVGSTYLASSLALTTPTLTSPTMTGAVVSAMASSVITSSTAQASTSGTSIDFTSIPSWVKRITVMLQGVSTTGTSNPLIQIGTGGAPTTSGYLCTAANIVSGTAGQSSYTTGFGIISGSASNLVSGVITIVNINGNSWVATGITKQTTVAFQMTSGDVTLGGVLNMVRITTVNGTDAFDAGTVNILYE
jgi:hypothetical protein